MKKKVLVLPAIALGLIAAMGFGAAASHGRVAKQANATVESVDHYMARFYNQDGMSLPKSGANYQVPKWDNSSNLTWKMSYGTYRNKDSETTKFSSLQLGGGYYTTSDENTTKCLSRSLSAASYQGTVFGDIFNDLGDRFETYSAALVSDQYISNIQDVAFYWNSLTEIYGEAEHAHTNIRIIYLLEDAEHWQILRRDDGEGGVGYDNYRLNVGSGTGVKNDWNAYAAFAGNYQGNAPDPTGDFATNLQGKTARLGVVFATNNYNVNFYYYISGVTINRVQSIKSYLEFFDNFGWVCSAVTEEYNLYNFIFKMGAYKMLQSQANALDVSHTFTGPAGESTYWNVFSYLCGQAGIAIPVSPSGANNMNWTITGSSNTAIIAIITAISICGVGGGLFLGLKKRKHN